MKIQKTSFSIALLALLTSTFKSRIIRVLILMCLAIPALAGTTYYISSSGNDANNGTSPSTPWKTPNRVTQATFQAGDNILFKRGDVFQGEITQQYGLNGTANQRITFGAYGTGAKPIIYGDMTGATWTKTPGRDSIWQAFGGYFYSSNGYEKSAGGIWGVFLHNMNASELHWYLDNPDSLKKFLDSFAPSSYGVGNDTVWVRTKDGFSPSPDVVRIFHEANFIRGNYVTVRDIDFRDYGTAVKAVGGVNGDTYHNMIVRNLTVHNTSNTAIFLTGHYLDCIIDSCIVDSTGYDAIYSQFTRRCNIRHNRVSNVNLSVLGINFGGGELSGIGMQQDTDCVAEYDTIVNAGLAGFSTYYNVNDTVRYSSFTGCQAGIYLNGSGWVAQNNYTSVTGRNSPGVRVDIHGTGQTTVDSNVIYSPGGGIGVETSEPGGGTAVIYKNTVTCSNSNSFFVSWAVDGITSTNNTFIGSGVWSVGAWPTFVQYDSLATFQTATKYEKGSRWSSGPGAPIGTFTAKPDTLPATGGTVMLQWTSQNATSAAISPLIGIVATSDSIETDTIYTTTLFVLTLTGQSGSIVTYSILVTVESQQAKGTQLKYSLEPLYPNPSNGSTMIEFIMQNEGYVTLKVFDTQGREIAILAHGMYSQGIHRFQWNIGGLASGVYYCKFNSGKYTQTRRIVVVR